MCNETPPQAAPPPQDHVDDQHHLHLLHQLSFQPLLDIDNSSCLRLCCSSMASSKALRELILTMPTLNIYSNIGFTVKNIQHESKTVTLANGTKRPIALLVLTCEAQYTEFLKSLAELQDKMGDAVLAEVKMTSAKDGVTRLDVFSGRVDLAAQLRSNLLEDDTITPAVLRIRLPHLISGVCDQAKVSRIFNYFTTAVISDMVKRTFDED